jgi:ABC-type Mn2+/Zn2+ transport system permease subunit/Mn-dependent DtxR family transcriptional regulator
MQELLATLSEEWAIRALVASSLVGIMCGLIGCFIVLRNMSLIGDALSHAILPGIFVAFLILGYSTIGFFLGSVLAGLLAAVLITWIQHNVKTKNDAAIGIVFTAMFSIGVIGISYLNNEQGVHLDLKDFLFGNVLGISNEDIWLTLAISLYTVLSIVLLYRYLFITTFQPTIAQTMGISVKMIHYFLMLLLSFAVVSALRTVGVILVVAMLITPAATALLLSNKLRNVLVISSIIGLLSAVTGLIAAIILETTPGPAMCIMATLFYALAVVFAPQKGILAKRINHINERNRIEKEDIIKQTFKSEKVALTIEQLLEIFSISPSRIKQHIKRLIKEGILQASKTQLQLTAKGKELAENLVRAHRLWESYQVTTMGLNEEQIHEEAERYEHLLTSDLLDELDETLGFPEKDPHGSPIPQKKILPQSPLLQLKPKDTARIARIQINENIESELWELGLTPNSAFIVQHIDQDFVEIFFNKQVLKISASLANQINVSN